MARFQNMTDMPVLNDAEIARNLYLRYLVPSVTHTSLTLSCLLFSTPIDPSFLCAYFFPVSIG